MADNMSPEEIAALIANQNADNAAEPTPTITEEVKVEADSEVKEEIVETAKEEVVVEPEKPVEEAAPEKVEAAIPEVPEAPETPVISNEEVIPNDVLSSEELAKALSDEGVEVNDEPNEVTVEPEILPVIDTPEVPQEEVTNVSSKGNDYSAKIGNIENKIHGYEEKIQELEKDKLELETKALAAKIKEKIDTLSLDELKALEEKM